MTGRCTGGQHHPPTTGGHCPCGVVSLIPAPRPPAEATRADLEQAQELVSAVRGRPVYDGPYVTRLAREYAQQRADGHAAGLAEATS